MKRRQLLQAAALGAAATAVPAHAHAQAPVWAAGKTAIVVGSGFGARSPRTASGRRASPPPCSNGAAGGTWTVRAPPSAPSCAGPPRPAMSRIHPLREVTEIRDVNGLFEVRCKQINEAGDILSTKTFVADYLFMAAGTVYTNSLLVTARARGWLPRLRAEVGKGFGNNGDFLIARLNLRKDVGSAQGGPGNVRFFDDTNPYAPAAMAWEAAPVPSWAGRTSAHLIVSMTPERGEIRYDSTTGTGKVYWPYGVMETKADRAGRDLATRLWWQTEGRYGYLFNGLPDYDRGTGHGLGSANTWHPLGGMIMGRATDFGGRSLDYPNLYCVDGSLLPGSACLANPSLTITANAERCLDLFLTA